MYGAFVSEEFYHGYSLFSTSISCLTNAILIYVLITTHVTHVGPYRWLLLSFAVIDILTSIVHFALVPALHMTEFGYIFWGYRWLEGSTAQGAWSGLGWVLLFYQTFVLTAFHYVYRFVLLCNPPWLSWIQRNPWRNWIIVAVVADVAFVGTIFLACLEGFTPRDLYAFAKEMLECYDIDLFAPNRPGFLAIVYWVANDGGEKEWIVHSLVTISIVIVCFFASAATILYCLVNIIREMAPAKLALKSNTRHMQKQLFRALIWQTIIPVITSYGPVAFIFLAPLITGINFGSLGTLLMMSTEIFPMLDPFLVLFFIQGYRRELPRMVQRVIAPSFVPTLHQSSTVIEVVGIPMNTFLLYLIGRFSRKDLGSYKHLLMIFAAHDIFLSIVEAVFNVTDLRIGAMISVVGRTFWESRHIGCAYVAFYFLPFFLTNLNFLYRYWAIKSPEKLALYSNKHLQAVFILVVAATTSGWYLVLLLFCDGSPDEPGTIAMRDLLRERFNLAIYDGWVVMDYWPGGSFALRPFLILLFTDSCLLLSFLTAAFLSTATFYHIQRSKMVSEKYRKSQRNVLTALCVQAIVPLCCVYLPYVDTLNAPFFGYENLVQPESVPAFISAFPLWDATVIILLMKDYREGALSIVWRSKKKGPNPVSKMFVSSVGPISAIPSTSSHVQ